MRSPSRATLVWICGAGAAVLACSGSPSGGNLLTRADLLDPNACAGCHQDHYAEWAGSMHAYASEDPVFLAMNRRGQRETGGTLGSFCVNCHAPMAVREGATTDGLNLDQVPRHLKGVTCYFCHSVDRIEGTHNNPLHLAEDGVMRGAITEPFQKGRFHPAAHSPLLDRDRLESAAMCGACHDIVTPHGAAIERTFDEWKRSVFSASPRGSTCGQCHMQQSTSERPIAQIAGAPRRRAHSHAFAAVDVAIVPFPDRDRQRQLVQEFLDTALQSAVCVEPAGASGRISVILDNVAGGHGFPSGSVQDRRAWVELIAWSGSSIVYSSGQVADGVPVSSFRDPDLWLLRDCMFDDAGREVSMFWQAASFEGNALPAKSTFDPADPRYYQTHKVRWFPAAGALTMPFDRITARIRLRPMDVDVLDDLIASGDLDARFRDAIPTFTVGKTVEWTPATATSIYVDPATGARVSCATNTNLNVSADKFPAVVRTRCSP